MRIVLHIGLDTWAVQRIQRVGDGLRERLAAQGVLCPRAAGGRNHTRLFMAVSDPERVDVLRASRGYADPAAQAALRNEVATGLAREAAAAGATVMLLSAQQLGTRLATRTELERLRALLLPLSGDITVFAHVEEPGRALAAHYAEQVMEGRARPLAQELALANAPDWWDAALAAAPAADPARAIFTEVQGPPHWLDHARLVREWEAVFGAGRVRLRGIDRARLAGPAAAAELHGMLGLDSGADPADPAPLPAAPRPAAPAAAWLARCRQFNALLLRYAEVEGAVPPRQLWRKLLGELEIGGAPIDPGSLWAVSRRFEPAARALVRAHPGLAPEHLKRARKRVPWTEADPREGFRASQYLLAFRGRIDRAARDEAAARGAQGPSAASFPAAASSAAPAAPPASAAAADGLSETARRLMPLLARQNFARLRGSPFAPHNRLGRDDEAAAAPPFEPAPPRVPAEGSSGNVIVGCMKNEAPYILEWVAYHRAIGVDGFLIYTNGCEDGTDEILGRLQQMGIVQHRLNDDWKGNSPQQYALNRALKEPLIRQSEWIIHIDVDEFINVRCGNGTLDDFLARCPDATNVAMTWRLFGHNGVRRLEDRFVIEQFETCAPRYCPKPHTVWGFKTMFRNIGAYAKISCHRPNKLHPELGARVKWVNGSGEDMTEEARENGWRNSKKSIGYDLLQLNHYALRSAESFLIKRQRGRALHVDRSIGLNYWIRMDWSDHRDLTIQRNLPRLRAEYERLLADPELRRWHRKGLDWHRAKADALHANPEFADLYAQALEVRLTETERVAYALALDMES